MRIPRRDRNFLLIIFFCFFFLIIHFFTLDHIYALDEEPIIVYAGTKFFTQNLSSLGFLNNCPVQKRKCRISENRKDFAKASAVIFNNADFHLSSRLSLPGKRNPKIPYIFWSMESPSNDMMRAPAFFINWTMHYRRDADIWTPYGRFIERKEQESVDYEKIWNSKDPDSSVIWLGSNCDTPNKRLDFIKALQGGGLQVDIFGKCGKPAPNRCDGSENEFKYCTDEMIRPYKFYLALENSNCPDYVTEKYFNNLRRGTVPIVAKRQYLLDLGLPGDSFVAVDDFPNISALISYLKTVELNQTEYSRFHQWREKSELVTDKDPEVGWCALCRKLQSSRFPSKVYSDIRAWSVDKPCDDKFFDKYL